MEYAVVIFIHMLTCTDSGSCTTYVWINERKLNLHMLSISGGTILKLGFL